jgi:hypothetical protein
LALIVGIAMTGFCYPGGILQVFVNKISKFCGCRKQQQLDRFSSDHQLQHLQLHQQHHGVRSNLWWS